MEAMMRFFGKSSQSRAPPPSPPTTPPPTTPPLPSFEAVYIATSRAADREEILKARIKELKKKERELVNLGQKEAVLKKIALRKNLEAFLVKTIVESNNLTTAVWQLEQSESNQLTFDAFKAIIDAVKNVMHTVDPDKAAEVQEELNDVQRTVVDTQKELSRKARGVFPSLDEGDLEREFQQISLQYSTSSDEEQEKEEEEEEEEADVVMPVKAAVQERAPVKMLMNQW